MVNFFFTVLKISLRLKVLFLFSIKKSLYILSTEKYLLELYVLPPIPYSLQITKYSRGKDVINEQCTIINVLSGTRIDSRVLLLEKCVMMFHQISVVLFFQEA